MTYDEIEKLAADLRQYLGVDVQAMHVNDGEGADETQFLALWSFKRQTFFFWHLDGSYAGVEHGYGPDADPGARTSIVDEQILVGGEWIKADFNILGEPGAPMVPMEAP